MSSNASEPTIRRATDDDAGPLAALAERTFRAAFGDQNRREDIDLHCATSFGTDLQAREIRDPRLATLVCEGDDELIAYGQLRWGPPPPGIEASRPAEIYRFYVDARWHGLGVAQALMAALVSVADEGGADRLWLGVWEHNPRAIAFYAKQGFAEVGEHVFLLGRDPQRDLLMARSLPERRAAS